MDMHEVCLIIGSTRKGIFLNPETLSRRIFALLRHREATDWLGLGNLATEEPRLLL